MHDYDFYEAFGEDMFDSEPEEDESYDLGSLYKIPMQMVVHLKSRQEPLFAEHVFFFEKDDPVDSIEELMNFTATWWSAVTDDRNIDFVYLTDSSSNKKALLLSDVVAISFMAPEEPEWMKDVEDDRDPD